MTMRKISKDEFYKMVGPLDVHPSIQPGPWPYTSLWKLRNTREVVGKSVGHADGSCDYFRPASEEE